MTKFMLLIALSIAMLITAQNSKLGLWSNPSAVEPYLWRRGFR